MFLSDPAKYAPKYDGHCAFGVARGGKFRPIPIGGLYLNITPTVSGFWNKDILGNIEKAEGNWTDIENKAAYQKDGWKYPTMTAPMTA